MPLDSVFDGWWLPRKCKKCKRHDGFDPKQPVTFLDIKTKLCEFCFAEEKENE
jgi:hypothetical protein